MITYVSDEAKRYRATVAKVLAAARVRPLAGELSIRIRLYRPRAAGDADNRVKVLFDALKGDLAMHDDDQVQHHEVDRYDDPQRPRVEIQIEPKETTR